MLTIPGKSDEATRTAAGLVTSATTADERRFPSPDLIAAAAAFVPARLPWAGAEGPRAVLTIGPGVLAVSRRDYARTERRLEQGRGFVEPRARGRIVAYPSRVPAAMPGASSRVISGWSAKSRARMVRTLAELDYGPLLGMGLRLPMTTLTYPGDWLVVAPDGQAVKAHLRKLWDRYRAAWGFPWLGIWKLEFQHRGAPHIHLWGPEPVGVAGDLAAITRTLRRPGVGEGLPYRRWLSAVWADIVDAPDPDERARHEVAGTAVDHVQGARLADPRRLAIYFTKHGSFRAKEYQNCVPAEWRIPGRSVGRFWGYRGLSRSVAHVQLYPEDGVQVARLLRRYSAAQGVTAERSVRRVNTRTGSVSYRKVRRPVVRMGCGAGFLCVNDGPAMAAAVGRWLSSSSWSWASEVLPAMAPPAIAAKDVGTSSESQGRRRRRSETLTRSARAGDSGSAGGGAVTLFGDTS